MQPTRTTGRRKVGHRRARTGPWTAWTTQKPQVGQGMGQAANPCSAETCDGFWPKSADLEPFGVVQVVENSRTTHKPIHFQPLTDTTGTSLATSHFSGYSFPPPLLPPLKGGERIGGVNTRKWDGVCTGLCVPMGGAEPVKTTRERQIAEKASRITQNRRRVLGVSEEG